MVTFYRIVEDQHIFVRDERGTEELDYLIDDDSRTIHLRASMGKALARDVLRDIRRELTPTRMR